MRVQLRERAGCGVVGVVRVVVARQVGQVVGERAGRAPPSPPSRNCVEQRAHDRAFDEAPGVRDPGRYAASRAGGLEPRRLRVRPEEHRDPVPGHTLDECLPAPLRDGGRFRVLVGEGADAGRDGSGPHREHRRPLDAGRGPEHALRHVDDLRRRSVVAIERDDAATGEVARRTRCRGAASAPANA